LSSYRETPALPLIETNTGRYRSELYGELGSDYLDGGSGHDILIGDIGHVIRRFDTGGNPVLQSKLSNSSSGLVKVWHKDIVLEEQGNITGVHRISTKLNTSALAAKDVMSASLLFIANAIEDGGDKYTEDNVWLTDLLLFDLLPSDNDELFGGEDDDVLIGQRGDDRLQVRLLSHAV